MSVPITCRTAHSLADHTRHKQYLCVRPKYTAAKLEGIKKHIYRIKMEQLVRLLCPWTHKPLEK